jgi:hypothetical protein
MKLARFVFSVNIFKETSFSWPKMYQNVINGDAEQGEKIRVSLCLINFLSFYSAVRNDGFQLRVQEVLINNHRCK